MLDTTPLGVSLYVPATRTDLKAIANLEKLPGPRSVIFCTEDAVAERQLGEALLNLDSTLRDMAPTTARLRFVRVRNPEVLRRIMSMSGVEKLDGFVLPKFTRHNFDAYFQQVQHTGHWLMPILETVEVFDEREMRILRKRLLAEGVRERILSLRIGGNDLLALLGMRRSRHCTIYASPLGATISRLVTTFRPYGFGLTAPVFEHVDAPELLNDEVAQDLAHGLSAKAAIHPDQVPLIERHYRVPDADVEMAERILDAGSPAVFRMHGSMCELATHKGWAQSVMARAECFGMGY